ncbi:MAG: helix-turn-helix domain-containing protein [Kiritimatiellae bacterium]|nr:helix-turn-helix domain-containing protein [Kiritimatiellia bacterium]
MKKSDFETLVASLREGAAVLRGTKAPSRRFVVEKQEVRRIRENLSVSQGDFASLMGVSVDTVQNWEQGRRTPTGPARVLLTIVQHQPGILAEPWFALRQTGRKSRGSRRRTLALA